MWILVHFWPIPYGQGTYKDSHFFKLFFFRPNLKRCESLYIPSKCFRLRKHTWIHTFSNFDPFEKVWILVCFLPIRYGPGIYKDSHLFWKSVNPCIFLAHREWMHYLWTLKAISFSDRFHFYIVFHQNFSSIFKSKNANLNMTKFVLKSLTGKTIWESKEIFWNGTPCNQWMALNPNTLKASSERSINYYCFPTEKFNPKSHPFC